ncbi:MAG: hypothetical protein HY885_07200 [Deltaproteobacteria bacterium]|nr:hypothetical protein [Deltaproteobacteria bacterium]
MGHKTKHHHPHKTGPHQETTAPRSRPCEQESGHPLALVIKSDTFGVEEAICENITKFSRQGMVFAIIHKGVGDICKTDILTAATGSKLIIGFNVGVLPKLSSLCQELNVEIRLYSLIYTLLEDLKQIALSLMPREEEEKILGNAKVIALFKGSRKGIIIGCEVKEGRLQQGDHFRVISAMGPIFSGRINALHIEKNTVNKATPGQQVGIKIDNFKEIRIDDLVESYQPVRMEKSRWKPSGKILHL